MYEKRTHLRTILNVHAGSIPFCWVSGRNEKDRNKNRKLGAVQRVAGKWGSPAGPGAGGKPRRPIFFCDVVWYVSC